MSGRWLFLVALLLVVGFAPAPFPRTRRDASEKDDLRKFQGTWVVTKYEHSGSNHLTSYPQGLTFTFQGDRMSCSVGDSVRTRWNVVLSPGSVPRAVTKTRDDNRFVMRGIYRFEGDKLIVCESQGGERPTEFDSKGNFWLIEMKRR